MTIWKIVLIYIALNGSVPPVTQELGDFWEPGACEMFGTKEQVRAITQGKTYRVEFECTEYWRPDE